MSELTKEERDQMRTMQSINRNSATCRSCKADIIWAKTARGKKIPLDAVASDEPGPNQFWLKGDGRHLIAYYIDRHHQALRAQNRDPGGYVSHFSTCPNADDHRKAES